MIMNQIIKTMYDAYGNTKGMTAVVLNPLREAVCSVDGITQFGVSLKFNDISQISFEVQRYIGNLSTKESCEENPAYRWLHSYCQLYVPELGDFGYFIINTEPTINAEGSLQENKTFAAESYDSVLQFQNLTNFSVNMGTAESLEMFEDNLDEYGIPKQNIKLYAPDTPELSLLDLVLHDDWYGWSVGHVDDSIASLERSFEIQSQNVYSFIRSDICKAFRCVALFDTRLKKINLYDVETVGENTNIYMSFRHFMDTLSISPISDSIPTVFNVAGDGDLSIEAVNYGSSLIYNIDWPISMCSDHIQALWASYKDYRESRRQEYAECSKEYAKLMALEDSYLDRHPETICSYNWASTVYYSMDDLKKQLDNSRNIVNRIEEDYDHDEDAIRKSVDAALYYSHKSVVIPDIEAEITARETNATDPAETVDQKVIWDLYGLNNLELMRKGYKEQAASLEKQGYDKDKPEDRSQHVYTVPFEAQHEEYLKIKRLIDKLDVVIAERQAWIDEIERQKTALLDKMRAIADSVKLFRFVDSSQYGEVPFDEESSDDNNATYIDLEDGSGLLDLEQDGVTFSRKEQKQISELFHISDYQDSNYLLTSIDDIVSTIDEENALFDAATKRLEIESRPQLSWQIGSEDLLVIDEFKDLRDQLQLGNFIVLNYNDDPFGVARVTTETIFEEEVAFESELDEGYLSCGMNDVFGDNGPGMYKVWFDDNYLGFLELKEGVVEYEMVDVLYMGNSSFRWGGNDYTFYPHTAHETGFGDFLYVNCEPLGYEGMVVRGTEAEPQYHSIKIAKTEIRKIPGHFSEGNAKMRVIAIDFSGLRNDNSFTVTFSNKTITDTVNNDFENLLGGAISSRQNAITMGTSGGSSGGDSGGNSLIRPYLEVTDAKIGTSETQNGTVHELIADNITAKSVAVGAAQFEDMTSKTADINSLTSGSVYTNQLYLSGASVDNVVSALDSILAELSKLATADSGVIYTKYESGSSYAKDTIVVSGGKFYRAKVQTSAPVTNNEYWEDVTNSASYGTNTIMGALSNALNVITFDDNGAHITRGTTKTMAAGTSTTDIATTEFVMNAIANN